MRKFIALFAIAGSLAFAACNNQTKTEEQIDAANQSAADSLLNEALTDTTVKSNGVADSLMADTTHTHVH
ncbi:hypothetical protein [Pedobacter arcticus]|uniref:hypothetical protein n=1 Tax=Pedobacter arcticus TaxID=752140 RepID=UPI0002E38C80|nr:hypothetical protein [Pedobacter arcticus]